MFETVEDRIALTANFSFFDPDLVSGLTAQRAQANFGRTVRATNDTTATATDLGQIDGLRELRGRVGRADVRDVYRFTLTEDATVSIDLTGLRSDADIFLMDTERTIVGRSANGGTNPESLAMELTAGEYFVAVQPYRSWNSTRYDLEIQSVPKPPVDNAGNSLDTAANIGPLDQSRQFSGAVGFAGDTADVLRFTVDATSRVDLELSGLDADADLYLYSSSRRQLAASKRSDTNNDKIEAWIAPGEYYLAVVPYRASRTHYSLSVSRHLPAAPPLDSPPTAAPSIPRSEVPAVTLPTESPDQSPPLPADQPLAAAPYFGTRRDWGLNDVQAPEAWAAGYTGQGVTVAIVDSGVQLDHPDLRNNIWENTDEVPGDGIDNDGNGFVDDRYGWDFISNDNNPADGNSHGTHVAGIVVAANNGVGSTGVAFGAEIMPVRVLDNDGSGSTYAVARGIRYAVDNGADIINLSLGGGNSSQIYAALEYARQNDVLIVAASGNESSGVPGYPARHSRGLTNVLSVGAYDNRRQVATFSNDVGSSLAVQIDAPGVSIYNTVLGGRYRYLSGTSMAAPYVAGVAALTLSANPNLTSVELRQVLAQGATGRATSSDAIGTANAARSIPLALA